MTSAHDIAMQPQTSDLDVLSWAATQAVAVIQRAHIDADAKYKLTEHVIRAAFEVVAFISSEPKHE